MIHRLQILDSRAGQRPGCRAVAFGIWLLWVLCTAPSADAQQHGDAAVKAGRDALTNQAEYPWYNPGDDSVRRVSVQPEDPAEAAARDSQWIAGPRQTRTSTPRNWNWNLGDAAQWIILTLVGLLVVTLIGLLIWAFMKQSSLLDDTGPGKLVTDEQRTHRTRVENLPFRLQGPDTDLLAEARRHYAQENYREAVIYLFSYKLVELDKRQIIRLAKGKTNRQYLREVRRVTAQLVPLLERTMIAFEDVFFGDHDLEREEFELCWNSLDEFLQLADRSPTLVAT